MSSRCCLFGCLQIVENHLQSKNCICMCAMVRESVLFFFFFPRMSVCMCAQIQMMNEWNRENEKCRIMAMSLEWHSWKDPKRADVKCTCNDTLQAVWMCRYWGHNHLLNDRVVMAWISNETETHWIRNLKRGKWRRKNEMREKAVNDMKHRTYIYEYGCIFTKHRLSAVNK